MKYLSNYTNEAIDEALKEAGAFWAFSNKQFDEQKREGVEYSGLPGGLVCTKGKEKDLIIRIDNIVHEAIKADIAENGEEAIIERELKNHEAPYTCDIQSTVEALSDYGFTIEQIRDGLSKLLKQS